MSVASFPPDAVPVNAAHLTAIMVKPFSGRRRPRRASEGRAPGTLSSSGPAVAPPPATKELVAATLTSKAAAVLDADALTVFRDEPSVMLALLREPAVLTP